MRIILHSDLNNCYASIESISHPEYRKIPFAVGGDEAQRHGIILAKNDCAKKFGIKTGEPLVSARKKCPELKIVMPNFELYDKYCSMVRSLYGEYTDMVEPFGMDESWLDTTGSVSLFGDGRAVAEQIRRRVKKEFNLTVSVGVSFNKVFAKLGSDYKKPDAVTVITPENFRRVVWPLGVQEMLFVGSATQAKLNRIGIRTIGELAATSENFLKQLLGKNGVTLHRFANGLDDSPVRRLTQAQAVKSVGNSTTTPRDMVNLHDAGIIFHMLSEQVCRRLRRARLKGQLVQIYLRSSELASFERQTRLEEPTDISGVVQDAAMRLLKSSYTFARPLRSVGVRVGALCDADCPVQLSFFSDEKKTARLTAIERVKDEINDRYGVHTLERAVLLSNKTLMPRYDPAQTSSSFLRGCGA